MFKEMFRPTTTLLLALFLLGCGSAAGTNAKPSASARLQITIWPQGKTEASLKYTLSCPAGKGTLPKAGSACRKLARLGASVFAPVPAGTACTMIYGGPQTALVVGRLASTPIRARFSRSDGCQIARWTRASFLLPVSLNSI